MSRTVGELEIALNELRVKMSDLHIDHLKEKREYLAMLEDKLKRNERKVKDQGESKMSSKSRHDKVIDILAEKGLKTKGFMKEVKATFNDNDYGLTSDDIHIETIIPDAYLITRDCIHIFEVSNTHRLQDKIASLNAFYEDVADTTGHEVFVYEVDSSSKSICVHDMENVNWLYLVGKEDEIGDVAVAKCFLEDTEIEVYDEYRILKVNGEMLEF